GSKRHVSRQLSVASSCELSRSLLPPSSRKAPSGPVECGRAGRRCVRCSGPHETALRQPAPSPSCLHFAALRSVTSAPAESAPALRCARQGAGLASTDDAAGRKAYQGYLAWQAAEGPAGKTKAYVSMSRGW